MPTVQFRPVRACIFDVDGLLIDSEDIYTDIYNKILREHGKPDLPWSIKAKQQSRGKAVSETHASSSTHAAERHLGHSSPPRMGSIAHHARRMDGHSRRPTRAFQEIETAPRSAGALGQHFPANITTGSRRIGQLGIQAQFCDKDFTPASYYPTIPRPMPCIWLR